ncbi:MAG: hypothetical protein M1812_007257 [Candelaria pacifica]|nr:MAG: hypothetical protein M1812_007257 [Candelaria pacifica]
MDWRKVLQPLTLGHPRKIGCTDFLQQAAARIEVLATAESPIKSTKEIPVEQKMGMPKRPREEDLTDDYEALCEMRKKIRFAPESILQMQRDEARRNAAQADAFSLVSEAQVHSLYKSNKRQKSRDARPINQCPPEDGSSPFLRIPSEVRLQIYQYLLPHGKGFGFCPSICQNRMAEMIPDPNFNLFQVSKSVSKEASSLIYGQNVLRLHPQSKHPIAISEEVAREFSLICESNRRFIRNLEIYIGPLDYFAVAVRLYVLVTSRCPDLYRLHVFVHKPDWEQGTPLFPTKERLAMGLPDSGLPGLEKLLIQTSHGYRTAIGIPAVKPPPTP